MVKWIDSVVVLVPLGTAGELPFEDILSESHNRWRRKAIFVIQWVLRPGFPQVEGEALKERLQRDNVEKTTLDRSGPACALLIDGLVEMVTGSAPATEAAGSASRTLEEDEGVNVPVLSGSL